MNPINTRIKQRREELGMSQDDLARKLGYKSRSSINKIELGINDFPQNRINSFAKALDTTVAHLMGIDDLPDYPLIPVAGKEYIRNATEHITSRIKNESVFFKRRIPVMGRIAAGNPIFANENIESYIDVESERIDYALRVVGDSMVNARIFNDDIVFVEANAEYSNGDIVIALINGDDATIKRFYQYGNEIILKPENPTMKEKSYKSDEVKLLGKVVEVRFKI